MEQEKEYYSAVDVMEAIYMGLQIWHLADLLDSYRDDDKVRRESAFKNFLKYGNRLLCYKTMKSLVRNGEE